MFGDVGEDQSARSSRAIGDHVLATQVARDHERGHRGVDRPRIDAPQHVGVEPLDGFALPAGRTVIGRLTRIDGFDVGLVGAAARIGLRLQQVVEPLVTQPLDLPRRERGSEQDLREELEGLAEPGGRDVDAHAGRVPAGVRMDGGAQPLARLDQGDRVVSLGALGQGAGRKDGRAALVRGLVHGTDRQHDGRADQRATGQVRDQDAEPVVQPCGGEVRELVRPRDAGCRAFGDDVPVELDAVRGGHAASSSSRSVSVSVSAFSSESLWTAPESAGAISGR